MSIIRTFLGITLIFFAACGGGGGGDDAGTPSFSGTIADQNYVNGVAITALTLPGATGRDLPLTYSITSALPAGLSFNSDTRVLSGTPTETSSITVTYRVQDADGDEEEFTFTINVAADTEPSFDTATIDAPDYINGIAITPLDLPEASGGNAPLNYSLTGQPAGLSLTGRRLVGTPTEEVSGQTATYTVTDVDGDEAALTFMITVVANESPDFGSQTIPAQNYVDGEPITPLELPQATTGGNGNLSYSIDPVSPFGLTFDPATRRLMGTPTGTGGPQTITYKVVDADGDMTATDEDTLTFTITVDEKRRPSFVSGADDQNYIKDIEITPMELPEATGGDDPTTYSLTPTLPPGLEFDSDRTRRILSGTPTELGITDMTYTARDGDGDETRLTFTITVAEDTQPDFGGQMIDAQNYINGVAIMPLDLPEATDGNAPLLYSFTGLPAGLRLENGQLVGTPTEDVIGRSVTYTVRDEDGDEEELTFTITVAADTQPDFGGQMIDAQNYVNGLAIMPLSLPEATGGNAPLVYSFTGLPAGLRLENGQLVGTPTEDVIGRSVIYTAVDENGDEATIEFMITVAANDPPDFGSETIDAPSYIEGIGIQELELPAASGGNGDLSYSIDPVSPFGLTFNSDTRTLSGTPSGTGMETVTYKAVDADEDTQATDEDTLTFTITVAANDPPDFGSETIDAPSYIEGIAIQELELPEASGGNGDLRYSIDPVSPFGLTFNSDTRTLSGTPTGMGMETVTYTVVDADGDMTATDEAALEFTINVAEDTEPGFDGQMIGDLQYIPDSEITPVTLPQASGGNPPLRYSLTTPPAGLTFNTGTRVLSGIPSATLGTTDMTYTVRDEDGDERTLTFTIEIIENAVPGFAGQEIDDQEYVQNVAITTMELPEASGGNGNLTYSLAPLPDGILFNSGTRELSGSPVAVGSTSLTYTARDEDGDEVPLTFMINVAEDTEPSFDTATIDAPDYINGIAITPQNLPEASGGNPPLRYSLTGQPAGLNLTGRQLVGTPSEVVSAQAATYTATDVNGDVATLTVMITVAANDAPMFADDDAITINVIRGIAFTTEPLPAAQTAGNGTSAYSVGNPPSWLTFTEGTRTLSGTPPSDATNVTLTYRVHDGDGDTSDGDSDTLTVTVNVADNEAPSFASGTTPAAQNYIEGITIEELELPAAMIGSGNGERSYSIDPVSPFGLTFNPDTRILSGTPAMTGGPQTVTYKVVDEDGDMTSGDESTLTFTITVAANETPSFAVGTTIAPQNYIEGIEIEELPLPEAMVGSGNGDLSYSIDPVSPFGLTFNSATRTLSGTPSGTGPRTITYTVVDADGDMAATDEATLEFTITVAANEAPSFAQDTVIAVSAINGLEFTQTLPDATGGNGALNYSIEGIVPSWLMFDENNRILSGTPDATGEFSVTYKVEDGDGDMTDMDAATRTVTINVAANEPPDFGTQMIAAQSYIDGVEIEELQLPAASGGNGDLIYSIAPVQPFGLTFNQSTRQLSGTPTSTGMETVTYKAVDADGDMTATDEATLEFTITVAEDTSPMFDGTLPARNYVENSAIEPLPLPDVTGGNAPLEYSIEGLPMGLELVGNQVTGTPTELVVNRVVTYTVTDANDDADVETFMITVVENTAPSFAEGTTIDAPDYINGIAITPLDLPDATGGNAPLEYSIEGLPMGLELVGNQVTGTPTELVADQRVTYTVMDADGDEDALMFMITVVANDAPSFAVGATINNQIYIDGTAIPTLMLPEATGGNGALTYSIAPVQPFGLTFNQSTRQLSGTPTSTGMETVTYKAVDADGDMTATDEATLEFTITVAEDTSPMFDGTLPARNYVENSAIEPLPLPDVTGGNAPLEYSIEGLPMGLELVGNQVTGTPTEVVTNRVVTYTVTDADDDEATGTFNITVEGDLMPSFQAAAREDDQEYLQGSQITPVSLRSRASGGNGPLVYSLEAVGLSGRLPGGFIFTDNPPDMPSLTGTPDETAVGNWEFIYKATDRDGDFDELRFEVLVVSNSRESTVDICSRTQQVQDFIVNNINSRLGSAFECDTVTEETLAIVHFLDLDRRGVTTLQEGDFNNLPNLRFLFLNHNELTALPTNVFSGLTNLRDIILNENEITTLDENMFSGLTNLRILNLGGNDLTVLPTDLFDGLDALERLDLHNNDLTVLPTDVFDGLDALERLDLHNNDLTVLPTDVFNGLTNLRDIILNDNKITTFDENMFSGLTNLRILSLGGNNDLTVLPTDLFDGLGSLEILDLHNNDLTALPADLFDGLGSLEILDLHNNDLAALPADLFDGLGSLERLDLYYNSLETIAAGVFNNIVLEYMDLSYNKLTNTAVGGNLDSVLEDGDADGSIDLQYNKLGDPLPAICSDSRVNCGNNPDTNSASPSFGDQTIGNQRYSQNLAITPVTLPEARGGNGVLGYGINPTLPQGLRFDGNSRILSGTPEVAFPELSFTYTATDADGDTDTIRFSIRVAVNSAPEFDSGMIATQSYIEGTEIPTLTLPQATGGNGTLTYSIAPASPFGLTFNPSTRMLSGAPTSAGMETITYKVVDADGDVTATDEDTLTFTINVAADAEPSFGETMITDKQYVRNVAIISLTLPAATGGNGNLTYSLAPTGDPGGMPPAGMTFDSGTRVLSGIPTALGSTDMTYTAVDSDGDETAISFTIEVVTGAQPIFAGQTIDDQWYLQNVSITSVTLPEAAGRDLPLTYTLAPTDDPGGMLPAELTFNSDTRVLSGTPTALGSTEMTYTAEDSDGDEVTLMFTITVEIDTEPRFSPGTTIEAVRSIQNSAVQRTLPAATGGNGIPTYTLAPTGDPGGMLPAGLTFNSDTRVLSGIPTTVSFTDMTYTVRDTDGDVATIPFRIEITTDGMPSFNTRTIADQQYVRDQEIMQTLPLASGGNGETFYSLTPTPPPGLSFDRTTRVLSGTPTALGSTEMTYTASDFDRDEATLTFTIEVVETDSMPSFGGQEIEDLEYVSDVIPYEIPEITLPEATGGNGILTYDLSPSINGLNFFRGVRVLRSRYPLMQLPEGEYEMTYTVRDADGDVATIPFTINVVFDSLVFYLSNDLPDDQMYARGRSIEPLIFPRATAGPERDLNLPLTYSLVHTDGSEGILPAGLTLSVIDGTPMLIGTPTELFPRTGFILSVRDVDGDIWPLNYSETTIRLNTVHIEVVENLVPSFTEEIDNQVYIQGIEREPVTLPAATGGNGGLTYSLAPLPDGLMFDNGTRVLSGTPMTLSSTSVTYTATDADMDAVELMFDVIYRAPQTKNICSRTQIVEDAILARIHETDNTVTCDTVTELHLAEIDGTIILSDEDISSLQAGDFDDLSGLTTLDLNNNSLEADDVPEDLFDGLTNLQTLDLSNNSLGENGPLPAGLFSGLENLQTLDLSHNDLHHTTDGTTDIDVPEGLFEGLTNLQTLDLSNNNYGHTAPPEDLFEGLTNLQTLDLSDNQLCETSCPVSTWFEGLENLQTLDMRNNQISSWEDAWWTDLSSLSQLYWGGNTAVVPPGVCSGPAVTCTPSS